MTFRIEINRRSYYVESDEVESWTTDPHWQESREEAYESDEKLEFASPVQWAIDRIGRTDATEASGYPIGDAIGPRWWLSGTYADPYTSEETETTVRLVSPEWTPQQRAAVFRAVTGPTCNVRAGNG